MIDTPEQPIPLQRPFQLVLIGLNGQRLTKTLPNFEAQDLGIQF